MFWDYLTFSQWLHQLPKTNTESKMAEALKVDTETNQQIQITEHFFIKIQYFYLKCTIMQITAIYTAIRIINLSETMRNAFPKISCNGNNIW